MVWDTFTSMKILQNLIGSMVLKVSKSVTFAQKNAFLEFDKRDKKLYIHCKIQTFNKKIAC